MHILSQGRTWRSGRCSEPNSKLDAHIQFFIAECRAACHHNSLNPNHSAKVIHEEVICSQYINSTGEASEHQCRSSISPGTKFQLLFPKRGLHQALCRPCEKTGSAALVRAVSGRAITELQLLSLSSSPHHLCLASTYERSPCTSCDLNFSYKYPHCHWGAPSFFPLIPFALPHRLGPGRFPSSPLDCTRTPPVSYPIHSKFPSFVSLFDPTRRHGSRLPRET